MAYLSEESRRLRARLAAASTSTTQPEDLARMRGEFTASALADYLDDRLAAAPPLTQEQCDRIFAVIRRHALKRQVNR